MPREPSPGRQLAPELSSAVTSALRGGLWPWGGEEPGPAEREVRDALRAVCDDAHRRGLRAEQVIVSLKEAWAAIPEVSVLPPGSGRREMLARLVTLCIDEFYSAHGD